MSQEKGTASVRRKLPALESNPTRRGMSASLAIKAERNERWGMMAKSNPRVLSSAAIFQGPRRPP